MIKTRWQDVPTKTPRGAAVYLVEITPECAKTWFVEHNTHNRPWSPATVKKYKQDILAGTFGLTHQGIAFDTSGRLQDGQHRLLAVDEAQQSILSYVFVGQDPDAHQYIDSGKTRSVADVIYLETSERPSELALAIARRTHFGVLHGTGLLTRSQSIAIFEQHRKMIDFVLSEVFPYRVPGITVGSVGAAVTRAAYHESHDKLVEFGRVMKDAMATEPYHVTAVRLRDALMQAMRSTGSARAHAIYCKTQAALRAFIDGRALSRLMPESAEIWSVPGEARRKRA